MDNDQQTSAPSNNETSRTFPTIGVDPRVLSGPSESYYPLIESQFNVRLTARGEEVLVFGPKQNVGRVGALLADLIGHIKKTGDLSERYLFYAMTIVKEDGRGPSEKLEIATSLAGVGTRQIKPKTLGQKAYLESIENFDITVAIGPAGTGKTYLAVAMAVAELKHKLVNRLIFARPAVEAGESLGFLPGDLRAKVDPYLRPIYDALHDMMTADRIQHLIEDRTIEIVPLAFMRGRTLNRAFTILDEAQNATGAQMKMFLTRLGNHSKAVVTGDITQIDLEEKSQSGLVLARGILRGIPGISFVELTELDVVRHKLVARIIRAYDKWENRKAEN